LLENIMVNTTLSEHLLELGIFLLQLFEMAFVFVLIIFMIFLPFVESWRSNLVLAANVCHASASIVLG